MLPDEEAGSTAIPEQMEDAERLAAIKARIRRSLDDPRPSIPAEEVYAELERKHEAWMKARQEG